MSESMKYIFQNVYKILNKIYLYYKTYIEFESIIRSTS